jgi:hypothetical protein
MTAHQQSQNPPSTTSDQHSFTRSGRPQSPHVGESKLNYQSGHLVDQDSLLDDPHFLNFLHGSTASTCNATANNIQSKRVPYSEHSTTGKHTHPQTQGLTRHSNYQMPPDPSSLLFAFPSMERQQYASSKSASQLPFASRQLMVFRNQNEPTPQGSTISARTCDTPNTPSHHHMLHGSLQDQSSTCGYQSYCTDAYSFRPQSKSPYYTSSPYAAPAVSHFQDPLSQNIRTDTFSVPETKPGDSRLLTKRRRLEESPEAESDTYASAYTRPRHKSTTRAPRLSTGVKEPRSKRSLPSHSYDLYLGHFNSWNEAREELFGVKWTPPATADIPMTDQQKIPFVMQVYNAMTDFSEFYDKQGAKGDNRMLRQKAYDSRYIEARSWEVVVSTP